MRILFIGTGDIGVPSLEWLLRSGKHEIVAIVTQPDKPVGRKQVFTPPQVKVVAQAAGVSVLQPVRIRLAVDELAAFQPDVAVVIAYGQILSRAVLDVPRLGCFNVHTSLLPLYRGAAPIQAAIRAGDHETGVTIMFMDEGLDTGDVLLTQRVPITPEDTGGTLHDKLAAIAPVALERALDLIAAGHPPRMPQDDSRATHVGKLTREDGRIDWKLGADEIERTIRAFNPWPGTFCQIETSDGSKVTMKIHAAKMVPHGEACPVGGTVVSADAKAGLIVACGSGLLELCEVQIEGGRRMDARSLLRGHPISAGSRLT